MNKFCNSVHWHRKGLGTIPSAGPVVDDEYFQLFPA